jgi:putative transposase
VTYAEGIEQRHHVHMCISIPPKYSVSTIVGYLKGKSAIAIARQFGRGKTSLVKFSGHEDILFQL